MSVLFENIEIEEISEVNNHEYDSSGICFIGSDNNTDLSALCDQEDQESDISDTNLENKSGPIELKPKATQSRNMDKNLLVMLSNGTLSSLRVYEISNDKCVSTSEAEIVNKAKSKKNIQKKESSCVADSRIEIKCPVSSCGKIYSSFTELLNHKKIHNGESMHVCEFCNRKFATSYSLKSHKRTHTGEKPYICPETSCNKKFNTSGDLSKHVRTHTGERPFQCELCVKSFTTSNIRKVHMRTHTGEKPYHCKHEGCSRKFSSATNFQNHSRIHTGEKPYICSYEKCQSRFTEYSSLYKHYLVHSVIKKHVCTICKRQYKQLSSLNIHINSAHSNEDFKVVKDSSSDEHTYTAKIWNGYSLSSDATSDVEEEESPKEADDSIRTGGVQNSKIKSEIIDEGSEAIYVLTSFTRDNDSIETNVLNNDPNCIIKEEL